MKIEKIRKKKMFLKIVLKLEYFINIIKLKNRKYFCKF